MRASLNDDAVSSLSDISYERVAASIRLRLHAIDGKDVRYVLVNNGDRPHNVVPLAAQHWGDERFSKSVRDGCDCQLVFLGSEIILDAMAEAAVQGFERAMDELAQHEHTQDFLEQWKSGDVASAMRVAVSTPVHEQAKDEDWQDVQGRAEAAAEDAYEYLLLLADQHPTPELETAIAAAELSLTMMWMTRAGLYFPLVLLKEPLLPAGSGDETHGTRRAFLTHGALPPATYLTRVRYALGRAWAVVRHLVWLREGRLVEFRASWLARSMHMRIVVPEGMVVRRPRVEYAVSVPVFKRIKARFSGSRRAARREAAEWERVTDRDYKFVRRREHLEQRAEEAARRADEWFQQEAERRAKESGERLIYNSGKDVYEVHPKGDGQDHLTNEERESLVREVARAARERFMTDLFTYRLRVKYREPIPTYLLSLFALVGLPMLAYAIAGGWGEQDITELLGGTIAMMAMVATIWLGAELGVREVLSERLSFALMLAALVIVIELASPGQISAMVSKLWSLVEWGAPGLLMAAEVAGTKRCGGLSAVGLNTWAANGQERMRVDDR